MGNWNTGGGSAGDFDDSFNEAMGYGSADDADSRDSGDYSMTADEARTAGVPTGPAGDSDPMGMADLAAQAGVATGGVVDRAAVDAAVSAMDAGLTGGDGSGYRGAYTLPTARGPITMAAPVTRRSPVSIDLPNYVPTNYTQTNLDKALEEYGSARADAYANKQFGFDFGLLGGPYGIYEKIADALFDPKASLANQMAERGYATFNGQAVPSSVAGYNPMGLELATAGGPLSQGGRTAAYDPLTNSVYDSSPFSGLNPFGKGVPDNIQALYDKMNEQREVEMARQGGDNGDGGIDQPLIIPEEVAAVDERGEQTAFPSFTPRTYEYQPFTSKFYTIPSRFTQPNGLLG